MLALPLAQILALIALRAQSTLLQRNLSIIRSNLQVVRVFFKVGGRLLEMCHSEDMHMLLLHKLCKLLPALVRRRQQIDRAPFLNSKTSIGTQVPLILCHRLGQELTAAVIWPPQGITRVAPNTPNARETGDGAVCYVPSSCSAKCKSVVTWVHRMDFF